MLHDSGCDRGLAMLAPIETPPCEVSSSLEYLFSHLADLFSLDWPFKTPPINIKLKTTFKGSNTKTKASHIANYLFMAQAKLKNKTVEMTSETPESTSPITVIETEHTVRISASDLIMTDRTAESVQEQVVEEDLMDRQAYRIETSFMAAMNRFSTELRTLFQERMLVTSLVTPPGAGQRSQERERFEPYGESSSLGASARTQALGHGQHS
ncbi:unnamed protein product [Prunus brigantina]